MGCGFSDCCGFDSTRINPAAHAPFHPYPAGANHDSTVQCARKRHRHTRCTVPAAVLIRYRTLGFRCMNLQAESPYYHIYRTLQKTSWHFRYFLVCFVDSVCCFSGSQELGSRLSYRAASHYRTVFIRTVKRHLICHTGYVWRPPATYISPSIKLHEA